ncbi:hypothetical protein DP113_20455 [Brasilonema octagenarum UFV-E1]|uniref:Uncharacterized protein n=1 Tax=Brasilonema sennae CENA114 TaxID=415709 RepID=A0A856MF45_9CYAN|nr:hypothetical protein [Brasilonema sennae]QDL09955.1 hypothetical protein DP114_20530 [Brasilonema sennae CENA114]QDL16307.1 hypothetical protein DP113_20455 [Brasilonema octagenarum UFV-E1]
MNPLFTEIAASQATSVVGGYAKSTDSTTYSNQATLAATATASTEQADGTYSTDVNGSVEANDQKATSSLNITAVISY